ncbi:MAG: FecR domain-containing protein [Novosphingobium sp.]
MLRPKRPGWHEAPLRAALPVACAGLLVLAGSPANAAPPVPEPESISYEMKPGDNLYALARRYLTSMAAVGQVQRINRIANVYRVPVGTQLRIPLGLLRAEPLTARILSVRGAVRATQAGQAIALANGGELTPGTLIETGGDGLITLGLPNGSRTSLPTRTRLRITQLRRFLLTNSIDYDFTVETGKAETSATPLGTGGGLFRIRTPRAIAAVRGTQFRVGLAGEDALAEVLEGTVAAGAVGALPEPIGKGFGAVVSDKGLTREALLPAPVLTAPGRVQIDPLVRLAYETSPGAGGYHLQIAKDASFTEVIADRQGKTPVFELAEISDGSLFVRASAIAASGLEGEAQTYAMRRRLTGLTASAAADADRMTFKWGGQGSGRRLYRFQLARDAKGGTPLIDEPGLESDGITLGALGPGTYFWRVGVQQFGNAANGDDQITETWLPFDRIIVAAPEP